VLAYSDKGFYLKFSRSHTIVLAVCLKLLNDKMFKLSSLLFFSCLSYVHCSYLNNTESK